MLLESSLYRKVRDGIGCIQSGPQRITVKRPDGQPAPVSAGVRIAGADHDSQHLAVWSGKKVEVYEISSETCRYVAAFAKVTPLIAVKGDSIYCLVGSRIEVCNLQVPLVE